MKISAKTDYACRALLELSLHWPNIEPVQLNTIAKNQNIPIKFLTQIMLTLKQMGYIYSIRGKKGGYLLVQGPNSVRLSDIVMKFEHLGVVNKTGHKVLDSIWQEVNQTVRNKMNEINFELIVKRQKNQEKVIMFQI